MILFILAVVCKIVPQLFFYMDGFDIKWSTKADVPLKKELEP